MVGHNFVSRNFLVSWKFKLEISYKSIIAFSKGGTQFFFSKFSGFLEIQIGNFVQMIFAFNDEISICFKHFSLSKKVNQKRTIRRTLPSSYICFNFSRIQYSLSLLSGLLSTVFVVVTILVNKVRSRIIPGNRY